MSLSGAVSGLRIISLLVVFTLLGACGKVSQPPATEDAGGNTNDFDASNGAIDAAPSIDAGNGAIDAAPSIDGAPSIDAMVEAAPPPTKEIISGHGRVTGGSYSVDVQIGHPLEQGPVSGGDTNVEGAAVIKR